MKEVLWLTFLMAFAFLFSFKLNLSSATICIASVDDCYHPVLINANVCVLDPYACFCYKVPDCNSDLFGRSLNCCIDIGEPYIIM